MRQAVRCLDSENEPVQTNSDAVLEFLRMSTSSATRPLSSTWVASTTMQRKWGGVHPSIDQLRDQQTIQPVKREEDGLKWRRHWIFSASFFFLFFSVPGARLKRWISHPQGQKAATKTATRKVSVSNGGRAHREVPGRSWWWVWRLSVCNPYTYLSVPVWRTYNTCVSWSAISNMNQWNTNSFWTEIMILYV